MPSNKANHLCAMSQDGLDYLTIDTLGLLKGYINGSSTGGKNNERYVLCCFSNISFLKFKKYFPSEIICSNLLILYSMLKYNFKLCV